MKELLDVLDLSFPEMNSWTCQTCDFNVTAVPDIFGMSFFMHVKHNSGLDELFNFETCMRSMMVLFQVAFISILPVVTAVVY